MSEIKIKDLILTGDEIQVAEKKRGGRTNTPQYSIVVENDSDIVIRKRVGGVVRLLCLIFSQGQVYIKYENNGKVVTPINEHQVANFLKDIPTSLITKFKIEIFNWDRKLTETFKKFLLHPDKAKILVNAKYYTWDINILDYFETDEKWAKKCLKLVANSPQLKLSDIFKLPEEIRSSETGKILFNRHMLRQNFEFIKLLSDASRSSIFSNGYWYYDESAFMQCLRRGNIHFKKLLEYLYYNVFNFQGLTPGQSFSYNDYKDYLEMQKEMYGKIKEKYPDNFLSEKARLVSRYNNWKRIKHLNITLNIADDRFSFDYNELAVITPKISAELIDEGQNLRHCVAQYVDRIIGDTSTTKVCFIRKKDSPEESYYTVEVNDNNIVQVKGINNRMPSIDVSEFLLKWAEKTGLNIESVNNTQYSDLLTKLKELSKKKSEFNNYIKEEKIKEGLINEKDYEDEPIEEDEEIA